MPRPNDVEVVHVTETADSLNTTAAVLSDDSYSHRKTKRKSNGVGPLPRDCRIESDTKCPI